MEVMNRSRGVLLSLQMFFVSVLTIRTVGPREYCNRESFNASCSSDEVIFMSQARYGRMDTGKCVKTNLGYLGCAVDVLGIMDAKCSGQSHCEVAVNDDVLYQTRPCPADTTSHLEASYSCVKVAVDRERTCQKKGTISVKEQGGYLASRLAIEMGWGTQDCPWTIHVDQGRTLNITFLNFARRAGDDPSSPGILKPDSSICYEIGTIYEGKTKKDILTCGSDQREKNVYISSTNQVHISFADRSTLKSLGYFVLKYEATGCPDPKVPNNSYITRTGDKAVVRCNFSDDIWYTECHRLTWTGPMGVCPEGPSGGLFGPGSSFPYGILIVVSIGVALGVFFGGLLLSIAIFYVKRRQGNSHPPEARYQAQTEALRENVGPKDIPDDSERSTQWSTYGTPAGYPAQYDPRTLEKHHHIPDYSQHTLPLPSNKDYGSRNHIYESPQFS